MPIIFSYIFLLVGALVLAIIGVIIAFLGEKACLSRQCVGQAKFIHRSMSDVMPCEDFYSFVCGKFPQYGTSIIDEIQKKQLKRLTEYLGVPADWEEDDRIEHIAKSLYQNCINDSQLESETARPIQRVMKRLGGIPFLESLWDYEKAAEFRIVKTELKHFFNGLNSIFVYNRVIRYKTNPILHPKNESEKDKKRYLYHVFSIPPHLYHAVPPDPENYLKYCTEFNEHFRYDLGTNKNITKKDIVQIKAAANFKIKLLKIIDKLRNCSQEPFMFEEYDTDFGSILGSGDYEEQLITYIRKKAEPGYFSVDYVLRTPSFKKYIVDLNNLLKAEPPRVLANYMGVEALIQMTPFLPAKYRELYNKYFRTEAEKNTIVANRPVQCAKIVKDAMVSTLTAQYLKQNKQPPEGIVVLQSLVNELKIQVKAILKKVKWPTKKDKYKMLAFVQTMQIVSPLPLHVRDELLDEKSFELFNLIMCANDESTLETYLSVRVVRGLRNAQLLNHRTDTGLAFPYTVFHEDYDIFDTAIYYQEDSNEIVVPMAYLFYPALDSLWPKYLNYGGLAVWIAHLLIKTISYSNVLHPGRYKRPERKGKGQLNAPWFDMGTVHGYENKRKCALKEYNQYLKPFKVKCNDANCLEDTLYYAVAVQAAYLAYKEDTRRRFFLEPRIPYFTRYTIDQIFFIKYASSFCQYAGSNYPSIIYKKDKNTALVSANFTVMYGLRNFPKFSEVFGCGKDHNMFKAEPCCLWN